MDLIPPHVFYKFFMQNTAEKSRRIKNSKLQ